MALGRTVVGPANQVAVVPISQPAAAVNTRNALWPDRWPAIALQACVDRVEEAAPEDRAAVKRELPCRACPENTRCLNAKRKELGPLLYDREILTEPRSQESTLFPFERFAPMLNQGLTMVPFWQKPQPTSRYVVVSGWDLAWSERVGGDRLVRCTAQLDLKTNKRRLLNIQRYPEGLRYSEQCRQIEAAHAAFHEDLVVVETDAAQVIWAQALEENTDVPVFRHAAGDDKRDLKIGVPGILIDLDAHRWEFPYMESGPGYDEMLALLSEFSAFGWTDGKLEGVGAHDDMVMAFWHCTYGLRLMNQQMDEFHAGTQDGRYEA
jgi:hypothetical protein